MECGFEYGIWRRKARLRGFICVVCGFSGRLFQAVNSDYSDWYDYAHRAVVGKIDLSISIQFECFRVLKGHSEIFRVLRGTSIRACFASRSQDRLQETLFAYTARIEREVGRQDHIISLYLVRLFSWLQSSSESFNLSVVALSKNRTALGNVLHREKGRAREAAARELDRLRVLDTSQYFPRIWYEFAHKFTSFTLSEHTLFPHLPQCSSFLFRSDSKSCISSCSDIL